MCGLLHCVHLNEKLMFWRENLAIATPASFLQKGSKVYVCRSATLDVGLNMPDPGQVPDGAKCGHEKVSLVQSVLKSQASPLTCVFIGKKYAFLIHRQWIKIFLSFFNRFVTTINAHLLQEFQQKTAQTATAMGYLFILCDTLLKPVTVFHPLKEKYRLSQYHV